MGLNSTKPEDVLTQQEIQDLKDTFKLFDHDGSGTISTEELEQVLKALGQEPTEEELTQMVNDVDEDASGTIELDEFLKMMAKRSKGYEKEVKMAFKTLHRGGFISHIELKNAFKSIGEPMSDNDIKKLLNVAGAKNGKVNYKQFSTMMKGILESSNVKKDKVETEP